MLPVILLGAGSRGRPLGLRVVVVGHVAMFSGLNGKNRDVDDSARALSNLGQ